MQTANGPPPGLDAVVLQRFVQYYNDIFQGGVDAGTWAQDPQAILRRFNDIIIMIHSTYGHMEANIAADFQSVTNSHAADIGVHAGNIQTIFAGMKAFEDRLQIIENRAPTTTTTTGSKPPFERPLLESKTISNIKPLKDDRSEYKIWMDKLVNAIAQSRSGSRIPLDTILK